MYFRNFFTSRSKKIAMCQNTCLGIISWIIAVFDTFVHNCVKVILPISVETWLISMFGLLVLQHIFCEDCISLWFDRERTCPMCRAKVVADPTWRDGSTATYVILFWQLTHYFDLTDYRLARIIIMFASLYRGEEDCVKNPRRLFHFIWPYFGQRTYLLYSRCT